MEDKIEVYKYLRERISSRVKEKREVAGLKQSQIIFGSNLYISAIENNRLIKVSDEKLSKSDENMTEEEKKKKQENRKIKYKNFLPNNVGLKIAKGLNMDVEEVFFGTEEEQEELVKFIFYSFACSVHIKKVSFFYIEKEYDYPQFEKELNLLEKLFLYDATFVTYLHHVKMMDFLASSCEENLYLEKYQKPLDYIWKKYKHEFIWSFNDLFIDNDGNFKCSLIKIDKIVNNWIKNELFAILEEIYKIFVDDTIYNMGYKIHELTTTIEDIVERKHTLFSEKEMKYFEEDFEINLMEGNIETFFGVGVEEREFTVEDNVRLLKEHVANNEKYKQMKKEKLLKNTEQEYKWSLEKLNVEKEVSNELVEVYESTCNKLKSIQVRAMKKKPYKI
ncbi:hypothetical protein [Vagococcus carniphilus]|uniref:Uncharacterized protein n=1 Tax=Vagococcus carniphilus TaxID=218144 RepID=A0A430ARW4_9ENTE|nr:hypothetical protein [Vagococcus carniphilus]QNN73272.1 hypothetical protein H9L18_01350 [Vagococcus carniphilus]RSU10790.1 hypothetical protein CBF28_12885 [Vagococcus carniphilus]